MTSHEIDLTINHEERCVDIRFPYKKHFNVVYGNLLFKLKALPSRRYIHKKRCWQVDLHPLMLRNLKSIGLPVTKEMEQLARDIYENNKIKAKLIDPEEVKFDLRNYQKKGIGFIDASKGNCLIADEPGLGKSVQAIGWMVHRKMYPTLIVCLASLKLNWENEIKKSIGKRCEVLYGSPKKGYKFSEDIVIINYDILGKWKSLIKKHPFKLVIVDEAQALKNSETIRTRSFFDFAPDIPHKVMLSATPVENTPMDLFNVFRLLNSNLFPSRHSFGLYFCDGESTPWGWQYKGATNINELRSLLKPLMIRRKKRQVLKELPERQRIIIPIHINYKKYHQVEREFLKWYHTKRGPVKATAMQKMETLRQFINEEKMKFTIEWIENFLDSGSKLIFFAIHVKVVETIFKKFKSQAVCIYGKTTTKNRNIAVEKFQGDPKTRLLVSNIRTGGVGLTLTAADTTCTYELPWNPAVTDQAEGRTDRIGQKSDKLLNYYMIAPNTIEETLMDVLDRKQKVNTKIMDGTEVVPDDLFQNIIRSMERRHTK